MPILSTFLTQLKCALEIFKSNSLRHPHLRDPKAPADSVARDSISSPDSSPSEKGLVPFKVLLIGRTVAVSFNASKDHMTSHDHLNDLTSSYEDVQSDSCNGAVTPILHVLLYNPLLTIQMDQECSKSEMSCFNMAALYSHQLTSVCECTYTLYKKCCCTVHISVSTIIIIISSCLYFIITSYLNNAWFLRML